MARDFYPDCLRPLAHAGGGCVRFAKVITDCGDFRQRFSYAHKSMRAKARATRSLG